MNVRKSDDFIADVERQFEWYVREAGWDVAERYLAAVEATCRLLDQHPQLGPRGGFTHPRLHDWRFFVVFRPFQKHVLFYEAGGEIVMRRALHGHRDLPRRLLEPPATELALPRFGGQVRLHDSVQSGGSRRGFSGDQLRLECGSDSGFRTMDAGAGRAAVGATNCRCART